MPLHFYAFVEPLEARNLFSVSPATLPQDQSQLQINMATYAADTRSCNLLIAADKAQVNADTLSGKRHLAALQATLLKDQATRKSTLQLDRNDGKIAAAGDNAVISRDNVTVRVDKNNPTQLAIDQQKLMADKIQLESDHVKFATILINDTATAQSIILDDQQAIITARATLDNPTLNQDEQTLLTNQKACLALLAADQVTILKDQLKIVEDTVSA